MFLHPAQRAFVERDYGGPARISGSAGTGKTIVALHRAVWLARRHPKAGVLLTTFSTTLANALRTWTGWRGTSRTSGSASPFIPSPALLWRFTRIVSARPPSHRPRRSMRC